MSEKKQEIRERRLKWNKQSEQQQGMRRERNVKGNETE